jgi:hypothetical protein
MINHRAINEQMGLMQFFGGGGSGMALAGAMGAEGENVANIAMDDPKCKDLMVEVWLCNDCYSRDVNLAMLAEKKAEEEKP